MTTVRLQNSVSLAMALAITLSVAGGASVLQVFAASLPPAPAKLTARPFGVAAVDLDWKAAGGDVSGYRVERALGASRFALIGSTPPEVTAFHDSCLPASTTCSYRVVATNAQYRAASATVKIATAPTPPGAIAAEVAANVADYGYMWWSNGPASSHYAIKTSRYGMVFDRQELKPTLLFPIVHPAPESSVLGESWAESFPVTSPVGFQCQVAANGVTNTVTSLGAAESAQLVECGKFFQRRWHIIRAGDFAVNTNGSGLEVASWPDRISFVLRLLPARAVEKGVLQMTLELPAAYTNLLKSGPAYALADAQDRGFAVLKSTGSSVLNVDASRSRLIVSTQVAHWATNQEYSVGVIIYPAGADVSAVLASAVANETAPLALGATGLVPASGSLAVAYDADQGWHKVTLARKAASGPNAIFRAGLAATNNTGSPRVVRLNFDGVPFYIPGISAVLRDTNLNPVGIPVQLSKNWHGSPTLHKFSGAWFHGLTMLRVPANSTLNCDLIMVGQNWGGKPAATHSQLSVIGYGGNQQWDEAALGNYGETLCYDIEHRLTDNDCTDSRPILMLDSNGKTGQWCGNFGGAQFLRYYNSQGIQQRHSRMRSRYVRYCPNLAEAVFAGMSEDGAIEFSYSAGLYRSDDYSRGVHRLRMDVRSDFSFSRLVFFQQAADTYAYGNGTLLAYGNATNPVPFRQWTATTGQNRNVGTPVELAGPMPWAMTLHCATRAPYRPANRGFVLRSWKARLNGVNGVPPHLVERSTSTTSIFDIVPPQGVTSLKAGDFVEAEFVRFYVPRYAADYYGPNENFRQALTNYQDSCQLALREAAGNNLAVHMQLGTLERTFPIQIEAVGNRAAFIVTGGIGAAPVTFSGLSDYRQPVLEEKVGERWVALNQAVSGNDFWQADFNAERGAWEMTFNLELDGSNYVDLATLMNAPSTRTFRFRISNAAPLPTDK